METEEEIKTSPHLKLEPVVVVPLLMVVMSGLGVRPAQEATD
jgi:hypothetical protein